MRIIYGRKAKYWKNEEQFWKDAFSSLEHLNHSLSCSKLACNTNATHSLTCQNNTVVMAMLYLDKLSQKNNLEFTQITESCEGVLPLTEQTCGYKLRVSCAEALLPRDMPWSASRPEGKQDKSRTACKIQGWGVTAPEDCPQMPFVSKCPQMYFVSL